MPTSFIMAIKDEQMSVKSWDEMVICASPPFFIYPKEMQPEDFLMALLRSPWGLDLRDQIPWAKQANTNPNEVHQVVSQVVNVIMGKKITRFLEKKTVADLASEIKAGHPAVVSGAFTGKGHAIAVVGAVWNDSDVLTHLIVDDPYGDYFSDYKDHHGNGIHFPVDQFDRLWPGWYHQFNRNGV
jgi:hypothetical protein